MKPSYCELVSAIRSWLDYTGGNGDVEFEEIFGGLISRVDNEK